MNMCLWGQSQVRSRHDKYILNYVEKSRLIGLDRFCFVIFYLIHGIVLHIQIQIFLFFSPVCNYLLFFLEDTKGLSLRRFVRCILCTIEACLFHSFAFQFSNYPCNLLGFGKKNLAHFSSTLFYAISGGSGGWR